MVVGQRDICEGSQGRGSPFKVNDVVHKLIEYPSAVFDYAGYFPGGDKPRPYLLGETLFVVAGFIPACKGQNVEKIA